MKRLSELLADRASTGLTGSDQREWHTLSASMPAEADDPTWDLAAAALDEALMTASETVEEEPLPDMLRRRLLDQAAAWNAGDRDTLLTQAEESPAPPAPTPFERPAPRTSAPVVQETSRSGGGWMGWLVAAAAVVLAAVGWMRQPEPTTPAEIAQTPAQQLEALQASAIDLDQWDWTKTEDETALFVSGTAYWSDDANEGYMVFRGLQPNEAAQFQYQLWIFDSTRDDSYPVDGGVFDMPAGEDEVVVPMSPKIQVRDAALFAVTVEKPGGVVVSDRSRIAVLAQPPAA